MKKIYSLFIVGVLALTLTSCGKETVREVLVTIPPAITSPPIVPVPATQPVNKYDVYLQDVYNNSAQARSWDEADLLKLGTIICQSFDDGSSLTDVTNTMSKYGESDYDYELFAAIIFSSVRHLCPEWESYVSSQI